MSVPGLQDWLTRHVNEQARFKDDDRGELRNILMSGLTEKYNAPATAVEKEVDRFLISGRASKSNLDRLERHVQHRAARLEGKAVSASTSPTIAESEYSARTWNTERRVLEESLNDRKNTPQIAAERPRRTNMYTPRAVAYTPMLNSVPEARVPETPRSTMSNAGRAVAAQEPQTWAHLARYAMQLELQDKKRQKEGIKEMRARTREGLDRQMEEKRQTMNENKDDEASHFKAQQAEWDAWGDMEKVREEQRRQKAAHMKKEREEQVLANRKIREEETRKKKEEEKDLVNKIQFELDKEKKKLAEEKLKKKAYMNKVQKESEEERRTLALKAKEDSKREMDKTREHNRSLDEKDEAKRKEDEAKEQKQKENLLKMKAVLARMESDKGEADQKLAFLQKAEADGRAQAIQDHKESRLREMRLENQAFLFAQIDEKKRRKKEDSELRQVHASIQGAECQAFLDIEKQRSAHRRERNVAHRLELQKQIADNQKVALSAKDAMSEHELALNRLVLCDANELHAKTMAEQQQ